MKGKHKFAALAVTTNSRILSLDVPILQVASSYTEKENILRELLPFRFGPEDSERDMVKYPFDTYLNSS